MERWMKPSLVSRGERGRVSGSGEVGGGLGGRIL